MKLHEYQAKRRFGEFGVPVPEGIIATTPQEAFDAAQKLGGGTVVVKSQVHTGGRGKAGGVKLAHSPEEAKEKAEEILGLEINGFVTQKVLVDPGADIAKEIYFSVATDRTNKSPVLIASAEGGVDIEDVAEKTPEKIIRVNIDPAVGLRSYHSVQVASGIDLPREHWRAFGKVVQGLYDCYMQSDAELCEINPLVITGDGELLAVDGKMSIDDNALYRHPTLAEMRDSADEAEAEIQAREAGLAYIKLDGEIGCMVNGAGLAMASMDMIKLHGSEPANFLDIGGGATADKVAEALRIILADSNVKAVLFNIFGGITRGDEVAKGILAALEQVDTDIPMVARIVGTNAEEGRAILAEADMITAVTLNEAAQKAVEAAKS